MDQKSIVFLKENTLFFPTKISTILDLKKISRFKGLKIKMITGLSKVHNGKTGWKTCVTCKMDRFPSIWFTCCLRRWWKRENILEGRARAPCSRMNRKNVQTEEKDVHKVLPALPRRAEWNLVTALSLLPVWVLLQFLLCFNTRLGMGMGVPVPVPLLGWYALTHTTLRNLSALWFLASVFMTRKSQRPELETHVHTTQSRIERNKDTNAACLMLAVWILKKNNNNNNKNEWMNEIPNFSITLSYGISSSKWELSISTYLFIYPVIPCSCISFRPYSKTKFLLSLRNLGHVWVDTVHCWSRNLTRDKYATLVLTSFPLCNIWPRAWVPHRII